MEDRGIESLLRATLADRASGADVHAPVVEAARAEVAGRRRRRRTWLATAAAVALVGGGVAVVVGAGSGDADPDQVASDPTQSATPDTSGPGWRTESWGGVSVDVPTDWGYAGAPFASGGQTLACPAGPDGESGGSGWVGRPIPSSDLCTIHPWLTDSPQEQSTTPYVWLGADVDPGTVSYPGGLVEETLEVEGETLTVATVDPALRRQIIGSVRPAESCPATWADTVPAGDAGLSEEGRGDPLDATVCAYRWDGAEYALTYGVDTTAAAVDEAWQAQQAAPRIGHDEACMGDLAEFVVVQARYTDPFGTEPLVQRAVFEMGCGGEVDLGADFVDGSIVRTRMVRAGLTPWADAGIAATVHAPRDGQGLVPYLIGIQG